MSILGQRKRNYNQLDGGQNLSDVLKVSAIFSDEVKKDIESRAISLLGNDESQTFQMKQIFFRTFMDSLRGKESRGLYLSEKANISYQKLRYFYEHTMRIPAIREAFLENLIKELTAQTGKDESTSLNIAQMMNGLSDENFDACYTEIEAKSGHIGVIYFFGECIEQSKCLGKVESKLQEKQKDSLGNSALKDIDFFNLRSSLAFKRQLLEKESPPHAKSFSLSGGVSNSLAQLGYIREHYKNGGAIRSISGTSMGAIIAVFLSKIVGDRTGIEAVTAIDTLVEKIKDVLGEQIDNLNSKNAFKNSPKKGIKSLLVRKNPITEFLTKSNSKELRDALGKLAEHYGITSTTKFNDLPIPVIVNSSYQSPDNAGEKEVVISGDNIVLDALFAGANLPGKNKDNTGIFGKTEISGLSLVDFAANEQGNNPRQLTQVGIKENDIVVLDVGYSSTTYNSPFSIFSRYFFPNALKRDMLLKGGIIGKGGTSIDINTISSENGYGEKFSPEITDKLVKIGAQAFISPPAP